MRYLEQRQIGHTEGSRLIAAELLERARINYGGYQSALSKLTHVVDTPRRA
jgi:hypothetical protein